MRELQGLLCEYGVLLSCVPKAGCNLVEWQLRSRQEEELGVLFTIGDGMLIEDVILFYLKPALETLERLRRKRHASKDLPEV